jgi:SAM-dependent methyltransferase
MKPKEEERNKKQITQTYNGLGQEYYEMRKGKKFPYFYNELTESPTTFKLLGNVKGKKILDLGCGPGFHLSKIIKLKAKVKGIDISEELVKIAKKQNPPIEIKLGDITKKLPYKDLEFDAVISSLVLGHIANWNCVLNEVKRILKKDGIFIFSLGVPMYESIGRVEWKGKKFRIPQDYFNERGIETIWAANGKEGKTVHYHKTYGTIVKFLVNNGFEIVDYEDCKPLLKAKKLFPELYKNEMNFPRFCVWKVRKR